MFPDGNGGFEYQFRIADHLNNTRVMFSDGNSDGVVTEDEIITENNYYPFGLEMQGNWNQQTSPEQNYLFTGFERQHDYGLNLDMAMFRTFDFTSCRWLQIDPLASEMTAWSPYNYGFNNPIRFIDPTGMAPENIIIRERDPEGNVILELDYKENGELYDSKGNLYEGGNAYMDKIKATLDDIRKSEGRLDDMVKKLEESNWEHEITNDSPHKAMNNKGSQALPQSGRTKDTYLQVLEKDTNRGDLITHELKHVYNIDKGLDKTINAGKLPSGLRREEADAVNAGNIYRIAKKMPLRTKFGSWDVPLIPNLLYDNF